MNQDNTEIDKLRLFTNMQQSEARLHWRRNSYFLLVSSILLVALSQFKGELPFFIGVLGLVLNGVWFLIQYRSSQYIQYWKAKAQELATSINTPNIYPELGGIEIRKLAYVLPASFIMIWIVVIILVVTGKFLIAKS